MSRSVKTEKYDDLCAYVFKKTKAKVAVVIVVGGARGTGLSLEEDFAVMGGQYHLRKLPKLLRAIAGRIEKDLKR